MFQLGSCYCQLFSIITDMDSFQLNSRYMQRYLRRVFHEFVHEYTGSSDISVNICARCFACILQLPSITIFTGI